MLRCHQDREKHRQKRQLLSWPVLCCSVRQPPRAAAHARFGPTISRRPRLCRRGRI